MQMWVLNHGSSWQAELESHKREAARKSPEPRRRDGGASASKAKGSSNAREAALEAELDVTAQSLTTAKQEAEALSTGLAKANGLIEVCSCTCMMNNTLLTSANAPN